MLGIPLALVGLVVLGVFAAVGIFCTLMSMGGSLKRAHAAATDFSTAVDVQRQAFKISQEKVREVDSMGFFARKYGHWKMKKDSGVKSLQDYRC